MRGHESQSYLKLLSAGVVASCALLIVVGGAAAATVTPMDSVEPALIARINHVRAAHGLRALRGSSLLTSGATRHGNSMARGGYFRHDLRYRATWKSFGTWIRWYWPGPGYRGWTAGENLAWGAPGLTPAQTVTAWMNSPEHRANILGAWTKIGVAVVHVTTPAGFYGDYPQVTIVAAEFGRRT